MKFGAVRSLSSGIFIVIVISDVVHFRPDYISPMDDLAFDMYQDPEVAQIIRKLDTRKNEAVIRKLFSLLYYFNLLLYFV